MAHYTGSAIIKYDPDSTYTAPMASGSTCVEGQPIYLTATGYWALAKADARSTLASHIAVKAGTYAPTGQGNSTTTEVTGAKRCRIKMSGALHTNGGPVFLSDDTAGYFAPTSGTYTQVLGETLASGTEADINICPGGIPVKSLKRVA